MYDIAIIGGGPAGASAAIFTAKAGKKTLVFENGKSMTNRAWVENHYGVNEIAGPDLVETGKKQATKFGAEFKDESILTITKTDAGFTIQGENGEYQAKHVLFATGALTDLADKVGLTIVPGTEPRIKSIIEVDQNGRTNIDGIWAAGTVAGVSVHTIVTAGNGAAVAINIISELNGERYVDHDLLK
ncbi:thioredoxin reductase [Bacillus mesophilus]|uniref:FAD-dependent oxidoreductase n=1 Tax=Bacillus mesophilus TaxID=1808955 RepID=A0A6M0Q3J2_9BACI|nr:FAD-dependent oxidoreductase [Bacillus mesophilus]MBM7659903.1 thioredoxin reductase [Bacillus mesophilus]NEY70762.1 FAD-dependent oxidoreductase [Bacillus mesophilus]